MFETWSAMEITGFVLIAGVILGPLAITWAATVLGFAYDILDRLLDRSRNEVKDKVTSGDE